MDPQHFNLSTKVHFNPTVLFMVDLKTMGKRISVVLYCFTPNLFLIFYNKLFFGYMFDCDARAHSKPAKLTERTRH
jgi:hypothetical protein